MALEVPWRRRVSCLAKPQRHLLLSLIPTQTSLSPSLGPAEAPGNQHQTCPRSQLPVVPNREMVA